ncbi:hypothetical protein [Streptomyces sp. NPDC003719]
MGTVTLRDETATGRLLAEWAMTGLPGRMTVRELIGLRVGEDAARYNARPGDRFDGLVRPDGAEPDSGGHRLRTPRRVDARRRAEAAERAFLTNGFFVLNGDRQLEDLDDTVDLTTGPVLVFVRLMALAGG